MKPQVDYHHRGSRWSSGATALPWWRWPERELRWPDINFRYKKLWRAGTVRRTDRERWEHLAKTLRRRANLHPGQTWGLIPGSGSEI